MGSVVEETPQDADRLADSDSTADVEHFDLIVIGAGSGNSIVDERFAGWKIAIIDRGAGARGSFGGTCLNEGCIPTKMFVLPADLAVSVDEARRLGVRLELVNADFPGIRDRIFSRLDPIADAGLAWREQNPDITVLREPAAFVDAHTLQVGRRRISGDRIVLAAGSRPRRPQLAELDDPDLAAMVHTNETIMRMETLPKRMVILGAGAEAVEFAHIFAGLGSQVTLLHRGDRLLRRSDRDIAEAVLIGLRRRISIHFHQRLVGLVPQEFGGIAAISQDPAGAEHVFPADVVLLCIGRIPNADLLDVGRAGVAVDGQGFVMVDAQQRTNVPHIWALGDICTPHMLKHAANAQARTVQHNLLYPDDPMTTLATPIPQGVFTHPQVAEVGATEDELQVAGVDYLVVRQPYGSTAYGWALEDEHSFVKLLADLSGHLLGAHIVGEQATTLLQPLVQMMSFGHDAITVARGQYWPHPALTEVVENALLAIEEARSKRAGQV